jgi:glycosyltransferase involved in cell wall biosynthesis
MSTDHGSSAARPRVLLVSALQVYPPLSGGNLRTFALARALARHGLEVSVHSLVGRKPDYLARRPSGVQTWPGGIEEFVDRGSLGFVAQFGSYALGLPPLWITAWLRGAAASPREALLPSRLRERLAASDAVIADFPYVHPVFDAPSARGCLRVLSTHNVEHSLYPRDRGPRQRWLRTAVRRVDLEAAKGCDLLVACSKEDEQFFASEACVPRSVMVPNGIDVGRLRGLEHLRGAARAALGVADGVKVFLFTASKYGPNREAFEYLRAFASEQAALLARERIHILVVGSVTREAELRPGFTATGRVEAVEPFFAAADAALNPMWSGAGTNVKMGEFLARRLPILSTRFGARGFDLRDGEDVFLFEKGDLAPVLLRARRLFDDDPARLRAMAEHAYARNRAAIDMDVGARPLADAIASMSPRASDVERAAAAPAPSVTGSASR